MFCYKNDNKKIFISITIFLNSIIPNRGLCQCEYIKCLSISFLMEMTFETFKVFLPNLATLYLVMPQLLSSKRKSMNGKSPKITAAATKTHLNQFWKKFGCGCCWSTVLQKVVQRTTVDYNCACSDTVTVFLSQNNLEVIFHFVCILFFTTCPSLYEKFLDNVVYPTTNMFSVTFGHNTSIIVAVVCDLIV